jgi:hypothetical protein
MLASIPPGLLHSTTYWQFNKVPLDSPILSRAYTHHEGWAMTSPMSTQKTHPNSPPSLLPYS